MSRSYKQPYTKSKRFDATCRCHGGCGYCLGNRIHKNDKHPTLEEELKIEGKQYIMTPEEKIEELITLLKFIEKTTEDDYIAWQIRELFKNKDYAD